MFYSIYMYITSYPYLFETSFYPRTEVPYKQHPWYNYAAWGEISDQWFHILEIPADRNKEYTWAGSLHPECPIGWRLELAHRLQPKPQYKALTWFRIKKARLRKPKKMFD